jgi:hypothetical protein
VLSKSRPEKNALSKLIITSLGDFPELFWGLKDKLMNPCFLKVYFMVFQKIKTGRPEHIEAESGITETPPGVPRQGSTSHPLSLITLSITLFGETNIHLPNSPSAYYVVPRGRKMGGAGGHEGRRVGYQEGRRVNV